MTLGTNAPTWRLPHRLRNNGGSPRHLPSEDPREISGEVNRMIAAAINADPAWFWHGPGHVRNLAFVDHV